MALCFANREQDEGFCYSVAMVLTCSIEYLVTYLLVWKARDCREIYCHCVSSMKASPFPGNTCFLGCLSEIGYILVLGRFELFGLH